MGAQIFHFSGRERKEWFPLLFSPKFAMMDKKQSFFFQRGVSHFRKYYPQEGNYFGLY